VRRLVDALSPPAEAKSRPVKIRYAKFVWKDACYEVLSDRPDRIREAVIALRRSLEGYLLQNPEFAAALQPPAMIAADAPSIVRRMHAASILTGVGPMAAVAGTIAQMAVEAALAAGATHAVVNNGGDVFLSAKRDVLVGIHPGDDHPLANRIAFLVRRTEQPLAVCTSSGRMGHSLSFGVCDAAVVTARDAAVADAAATMAANLVKKPEDVEYAAERACSVPGVLGALIVCGRLTAMAGRLPDLTTAKGADIASRVLLHPHRKAERGK